MINLPGPVMKHLFPLLLTLLLSACGGGFNQTVPVTANPTDVGNIQVYFSKPGTPDANNLVNGPEEKLIAAINAAAVSVDMAIYELRLADVTQSLINAHQRGVAVRVFTDDDNVNVPNIQTLINAGVPVRDDQRTALMHNKFTVIDNREVWTGSMNLTDAGAFRNRNNLIRIVSNQAASNYSEEFEQLWQGIHNAPNATNNYFTVGTIPVDIHFSPDDNFRSSRLLPLLDQVQQSVHMLAFSFTSQAVADKLLALQQQGIEVKIVVDSGQAGNTSSQYDDLLAVGVDIRRDGQAYKMHHKVLVLDQRYVVTGSYNFSENAESRNDENSVVIENSIIAQQFEQEFEDIYNRSVAQRSVFRGLPDTLY